MKNKTKKEKEKKIVLQLSGGKRKDSVELGNTNNS